MRLTFPARHATLTLSHNENQKTRPQTEVPEPANGVQRPKPPQKDDAPVEVSRLSVRMVRGMPFVTRIKAVGHPALPVPKPQTDSAPTSFREVAQSDLWTAW
jgi:hypothetical protein